MYTASFNNGYINNNVQYSVLRLRNVVLIVCILVGNYIMKWDEREKNDTVNVLSQLTVGSQYLIMLLKCVIILGSITEYNINKEQVQSNIYYNYI